MIIHLKRFMRKKTWIRIRTKSGGIHVGQIASLPNEILKLEYLVKPNNLQLIIKISQIESVGTLSCENQKVWTN